MCVVVKATSINLRITQEFRDELQRLADYRGLSLSSLAHSILVKGLRQERAAEPEAFAKSEHSANGDLVEPQNRKLVQIRSEGELTDELQGGKNKKSAPTGARSTNKAAKRRAR